MSVAAPLYLVAAAMAAGCVLALHYIVMRQPPRDIFPTARFLPVRAAVMRTWARRPEELVLLVLRTAALILLGAAFARPVWHPNRAPVVRIIAVDRSRDVAAVHEVADSARRLIVGAHDMLVAFDSTASIITGHVGDSLAALAPERSRGNISAALIGALRASSAMYAFADSIEVLLISPAEAEELDAATDSIRALWPGAIRLVRVAARHDTTSEERVTVRWPDTAHTRRAVDTADAVVLPGATVVAPLERRWSADTEGGIVIARWIDGEPAAVERITPDGCARSVVVPIPADGDLTLRPEFTRFARAMRAPCGASRRSEGDEWTVDTMRPPRVAAPATPVGSARLVAWLLSAVFGLLLAEAWIRR